MPWLNRALIRRWLEDHNWSIERLAEECSALSPDLISVRTMRNAVDGAGPMRYGRVRLICQVTQKHGDGIRYEQLVRRAPCDGSGARPVRRPGAGGW